MSETRKDTNFTVYDSHWGYKTTAARFIVEQVYLAVCKWKNFEPVKGFWNLPEWKTFYRVQIILANQLIKLYSEKSVISAVLEAKPCSLRSLQLDKVIERYRKNELIKPSEVETFGQPKRVSLRDKLNNI